MKTIDVDMFGERVTVPRAWHSWVRYLAKESTSRAYVDAMHEARGGSPEGRKSCPVFLEYWEAQEAMAA